MSPAIVNAAFPIVQAPTVAQPAGASAHFTGSAHSVQADGHRVGEKRIGKFRQALAALRPVKYHWAAVILACTSLLFGGLGLHRFYLGYTGIGFIQLSGILWIGIGAIYVIGGAFSVLPSLVLLGTIMMGVGIALYIWQIIDLIRIARRDLQPRHTDYEYHRYPAWD